MKWRPFHYVVKCPKITSTVDNSSTKSRNKVECCLGIILRDIKLIFQWKNRIYMMFMWLLQISVVSKVEYVLICKKLLIVIIEKQNTLNINFKNCAAEFYCDSLTAWRTINIIHVPFVTTNRCSHESSSSFRFHKAYESFACFKVITFKVAWWFDCLCNKFKWV